MPRHDVMQTNVRERKISDVVTLSGLSDALVGTPTTSSHEAEQLRKDNQQLNERVSWSLVPTEDGGYIQGRCKVSRIGLVMPPDASLEEWQYLGSLLLSMNSVIQWAIGDWIEFGEQKKWGETYQTLAAQYGYEVGTLYNFTLVCRKVQVSRRRENLTFGHHQAVASKPLEKQEYWLSLAEANDWSVKEMREAMRGSDKPRLPSSLASREYKDAILSLYNSLRLGKRIDRTKFQQVRHWLDMIESQLD